MKIDQKTRKIYKEYDDVYDIYQWFVEIVYLSNKMDRIKKNKNNIIRDERFGLYIRSTYIFPEFEISIIYFQDNIEIYVFEKNKSNWFRKKKSNFIFSVQQVIIKDIIRFEFRRGISIDEIEKYVRLIKKKFYKRDSF